MNKFNLTILLSYDFSHNISVDLFHDKKNVVIALIYFLVFLWDLFVMGLVLSGEDFIKTTKSHMKSTCRKLKSQVPAVEVEESCASYVSCFRDSGDQRVTRE